MFCDYIHSTLCVLQVIKRLEGHVRRISGLAFSNTLGVLISCGVDTQVTSLCIFSLIHFDEWNGDLEFEFYAIYTGFSPFFRSLRGTMVIGRKRTRLCFRFPVTGCPQKHQRLMSNFMEMRCISLLSMRHN